MKWHFVLTALLCVFISTSAAFGGETDLLSACRTPSFEGKPWSPAEIALDEEQSLRSTFETPHIDMAGPGPIRVLALIGTPDVGEGMVCPGTKVRDLPELAQRFSVDAAGVFVTQNGVWQGEMGQRRLRALLQDNYDVFIFANCAPKDLPAESADRILALVAEGAGILCVGVAGCEWLAGVGAADGARIDLASRFPINKLEHYQRLLKAGLTGTVEGDYPMLKTYRIGKGRAAALQPRGDVRTLTPALDLTDANVVEYEYWIGLAGAVTTWLAGRDAQVRFDFPNIAQLARGAIPSRYPIIVTSASGGDVTMEVFLRDPTGSRTRLLKQPVKLRAEEQTCVAVKLPLVQYGLYYIEARASQGKSVVGFAATVLNVTGSDHIRDFRISTDCVERGGTISGSFTSGARARTDLVTRDGRVIARREFQAGKSANRSFSLVVPNDTTVEMRARLSILDKRGVVQSAYKDFAVPNRRRDSFNFIMWDCPIDPIGIYAVQNMSQAGFNTYLSWTFSPATAWVDWSAVRYSTRIVDQRDANGINTPGCWSDEEFVKREVAEVVRKQPEMPKHGMFCFSLGDENSTQVCCLHPSCMAAYRKFLAEQYDSIEALNASWGESYKSFDEVQLLEGDDYFNTGKAYQSGNYPRWFDRQLFARRSYADLCARFAAEFRKVDPKAITGFEGAGWFGEDVDAILDAVGMWNTYPNPIDDVIKTLMPPSLIRGNWMGYQKDAPSLIAHVWRALCMGANSVWWWRYEAVGAYRGFLRPTLDLWPATKDLADEMKFVRDGLGQLMIAAKPEDDGVAILYSVESAAATGIKSEAEFGGATRAHPAFVHILNDSGVQFRYVTPRRIAAGALKGVRALILPRATAMDPATAKSIRAFVEQGGTVIADIRPGVMDQHLKALQQGALDDVFGVKRLGVGRRIPMKGPLDLRIGARSIRVSSIDATADADYAPAGATAGGQVDGTGLCFVNRLGKGQAVLFNFCPGYYEPIRYKPGAAEVRALILAAIELSGVRPRMNMQSADHTPALLTELTSWKVGDGQVMALRHDLRSWEWGAISVADPEEPSRVEVELPAPKVVYDLRNGKCLGRVTKLSADVKPGRANFYGLFEKPIPAPSLSCKTSPNQGTTALTARLSIPKTDTTAVVSLIDPAGKRPDWAKRVVTIRGGQAAISWQLPADQPGRWIVEARELFTGKVTKRATLVR